MYACHGHVLETCNQSIAHNLSVGPDHYLRISTRALSYESGSFIEWRLGWSLSTVLRTGIIRIRMLHRWWICIIQTRVWLIWYQFNKWFVINRLTHGTGYIHWINYSVLHMRCLGIITLLNIGRENSHNTDDSSSFSRHASHTHAQFSL